MRKILWGCLVLLAACGNPQQTIPEEQEQLAQQVSIFASKDNQKKWILLADSVNFEDMQSAVLYKPSLLLKQDGEDSARLTGNTGSFNYPKHLVTIEGNAVIQSFLENLTISANRFFYDIDSNTVWSDGKTTITRGSAVSIAKGGVVTDNKLSRIELKKHTTRLPISATELKRK